MKVISLYNYTPKNFLDSTPIPKIASNYQKRLKMTPPPTKNQKKNLIKWKLSAFMSKLQNKISNPKPASKIEQIGQKGSKWFQKRKIQKVRKQKRLQNKSFQSIWVNYT